MRLFVALMPPAPVLAELGQHTAPLRQRAPGLRWTRTEQWHVTLAFLGEVDDAALPRLSRRLARAAARHPPPRLRFDGGGRFGDRVLWTGVQGDRRALRALVDTVRAAARRSGVPVPDRDYRPHLTLARSGGDTDLRPLAGLLAGFHGTPWTADGVALVRSRLGAGPDGTAVHQQVAHWPLTGPR